MKAIQLTKADFLKKVVDYENNPTEWKYLGDKPAIIDFYADWCGPCKMMSPIIDEIAEEVGDKIKVGKINVDENQELAATFQVSSIPVVFFIKDGKIVDRIVGANPASVYQEKIAEHSAPAKAAA